MIQRQPSRSENTSGSRSVSYFHPSVSPLLSNRQHLSSGACLEDKREDNHVLCCAVLCTTVAYNDTHTRVNSSVSTPSTRTSLTHCGYTAGTP